MCIRGPLWPCYKTKTLIAFYQFLYFYFGLLEQKPNKCKSGIYLAFNIAVVLSRKWLQKQAKNRIMIIWDQI